MGFWMSERCALSRLVEDEAAPIMARVRALEQIEHPQLAVLRRLLVNSKTRKTPVPSKLRAVAALAYAKEMGLRERRKALEIRMADLRDNPLGI